MIGENDEPRLAVWAHRAHHDERLVAHRGACAREAVGQERYRVDRIQILAAHSDGAVVMAG
jgi:hypothetical protein